MSRSTDSREGSAIRGPNRKSDRKAGQAALARLAGLGPKSAALLAAANIDSVETLRAMGAVAAYHAVRKVDARASLNLLWALEGALSGRHWQVVARNERTRLLLALDDLEGSARS